MFHAKDLKKALNIVYMKDVRNLIYSYTRYCMLPLRNKRIYL